jgi:uncharacterized membrane protein
MATTQSIGSDAGRRPLRVNTLSAGDLRAALVEGFADFRAKRGDILLIGLLYPIIGFGAAMAAQGDYVWLFFPLAAGLSILGPLVATGFYELARRREAGLESSWWHFLDVARSPSIESIAVVAVVLIALFGGWLIAAGIVYSAFFGLEPPGTAGMFLARVLTTPAGWGMILVGNLVGLGFALATLALSAVSLPMLIDRDVSAGEAMATSIAVFRRNPRVMARWGLIVAGLLLLGSIPLFMGLAVVLPWLGYATWHLYTKAVAR